MGRFFGNVLVGPYGRGNAIWGWCAVDGCEVFLYNTHYTHYTYYSPGSKSNDAAVRFF
jgi:hypothetical protein